MTDTEAFSSWLASIGPFVKSPEKFDHAVRVNPMGRLATPEEVARVVAFISSPAAGFVAGANWYVDGGSIDRVSI